MKGNHMGILAAYPTQRELPLSNWARFSSGRMPSVIASTAAQGNEFRLTDLDGGGCRWRFWMCSEDLDPQRLCDPAPKCLCSVQETLLGARWGASQSNPST